MRFYKVAPKTNNLHTFYCPAGGDTSGFKKRTNYIVNCIDLYNYIQILYNYISEKMGHLARVIFDLIKHLPDEFSHSFKSYWTQHGFILFCHYGPNVLLITSVTLRWMFSHLWTVGLSPWWDAINFFFSFLYNCI